MYCLRCFFDEKKRLVECRVSSVECRVSSVECRVIVLPVMGVSSPFSVQKIFDEVNCIVTPVESRVIKKSITLTV